MAYLGSMHSKLGKETLEKQSLDILPSESKRITADDALQGLKRLCSTPLWKFVDDGAIGECDSVRQWVSDLCDGRAPKTKLGNTSFLATAWSRLQYFATYEREETVAQSDGKSKSTSKTFFGTQALEMLLAELKKKKKGEEVTTDLLKPLVCLVHLLPSNKVADVKKLSEAAYARMSKKRPCSHSKSSASDLQPKKSKTEAQPLRGMRSNKRMTCSLKRWLCQPLYVKKIHIICKCKPFMNNDLLPLPSIKLRRHCIQGHRT
eukprot:6457164-Amphidinium_carterae.2